MSSELHQDRTAAGKVVATALAGFGGRQDLVVLGMARGGVAVAAPVAAALGAPLYAMVVRKLGVPGIEEVAFGAIAESWAGAVSDGVKDFIGIPSAVVAAVVQSERRELERRIRQYRGGETLPRLAGRTVIVVDDGLASGATLKAAGRALRAHRPGRLVAAVPVASRSGLAEIKTAFDEVVAPSVPEPFETVSAWYNDFSPVTDAAVVALLGRTGPSVEPECDAVARLAAGDELPVSVPVSGGAADVLAGDLGTPPEAHRGPPHGLVVFAHGGGSSRQSYRNRYLAARLRLAGWATLRLDLLLPAEQVTDDATGSLRFDVARITDRLRIATEWAVREQVPGAGTIVLFGASTGAAAAVGVAASMPSRVRAVIGRGGRVDLAGVDLSRLRAPMLLVVGSQDRETLLSNRAVARQVQGPVELRVVRGAGHTFEEPGALGAVGELTVHWLNGLVSKRPFDRWLRQVRRLLARPGRGTPGAAVAEV